MSFPPGHAPGQNSAAWPSPNPYQPPQPPRSVGRFRTTIIVLTSVVAGLHLIGAVTAIYGFTGFDENSYDEGRFAVGDLGYLATSILNYLVLIAAFIITALWLQRSWASAKTMRPEWQPELAKPWIWFGWITPIVSWWFPRLIIGDIAKAFGRSRPVLFNLWWISYLLFNLALTVENWASNDTGYDDDGAPIGNWEALLLPITLTAVTCVIAAVLWIRVVNHLSQTGDAAIRNWTPQVPHRPAYLTLQAQQGPNPWAQHLLNDPRNGPGR